MKIAWTSQVIFVLVSLLLLSKSTTGQITNICPTAVWNQTFRVIAGISGVASSTATTLYYPHDLVFMPNGTLLVPDQYNHRLQRFPPGGATGVSLTGLSLWYPTGIDIDSTGAIYIMDSSNYRVLKWNNGVVSVVAGGRGSGSTYDRMSTSFFIFVDSGANIYLSDYGNHRVTFWAANNPNISTLVAGGYGAGSAPERLYYPMGIFVDSTGILYIADCSNHRVQMWYPGAAIGITVAGRTGSAGPWSYQLSGPTSVVLDSNGYLYVTDSGNNRVQRWVPGASYGITIAASSTMGTPKGMRFDAAGNLALADHGMHRIVLFPITCPSNVATTTTTAAPQVVVPVCPTAQWNQTFTILAGSTGNRGSSSTLLYNPFGADIDIYGNLYVADTTNERIQFFARGSMVGTTISGITSSPGSSFSQLNDPTAIHLDGPNTMYILDATNYRVLRWTIGEPLGYVVAGGNGAGAALTQMDSAHAFFVDSQSNIYVSEYANHRVTLWMASNSSYGILVAGGNGAGSTADRLYYPWGIHVDSNRAIFVVDRSNHRVQRWDYGAMSGVTVAGTTGDAGPWAYQFSNPTGLAVDPYGYLYILDTGNSRVQKWWPGAAYGVTVIAASMTTPYGIQFDNQGNIVITDTYNYRVISFAMICPSSTTTTTAPPTTPQTSLCSTAQWNSTSTNLAGITGSIGTSTTLLQYPFDMAVDGYQNLYVADTNNHRIQFYLRGSSVGTTIAGSSGSAGSSFSQLNYPSAILVDSSRAMYILDRTNYRVLKWQHGEPLGYVVAGGNGAGSALNQISTSYAMFLDQQTNIYISDSSNCRVTVWYAANRTSGVLVAGGNGAGNTPERLNGPWGIYVDSNQNIYVVDRNNHRVQKWPIGAMSGVTVAGSTSDPGPWAYQFSSPTAMIFDQYGYMYVLDCGNNRVQKWLPGASYGVTVVSSSFNNPYGMQMDRLNNIMVADCYNHRVAVFGILCPASTTTTTAAPTSAVVPVCSTAVWNQTGNVVAGTTGTRGSTATLLYNPSDVAFDNYLNIYVADTVNDRIQFFPRGSFTATTVAGGAGLGGSSLAQLNGPSAIYVDPNRMMYILDTTNYRVLKWQVGEPLGYVVAGGRGAGSAFNQISTSYAMFVDQNYNIYVSDNANSRVTLWLQSNTTSGILVAGGNGAGNTPERLNGPWGIYVDVNGSLFIADRNNHRIQLWEAGSLTGVTVAGSTSDPGPYAYQLNSPTAVAFDPYGYLYILDSGNSRIQRWYPRSSYGSTVISSAMSTPYSMKIDPRGNLVVMDTFNYRVISYGMSCPSATTTTTAPPSQATVPVCPTAQWNQTFLTLAGSQSTIGSTTTLLYNPADVSFDGYQYMYVADLSNHRIQRFPPGSNVGTTVAGVTGSWGGARSQLYNPYGIHVTPNGTMFILDTSNYRVLRWEVGEPMGRIVAGGQGGGSAFNQLGTSYSLFVDTRLSIYVSESSNHRVTFWSVDNTSAGILVAGGNGAGSTADKLNSPWGVFILNNASYVVDRANHRVQKWDFGSSLGVTVAGNTGDAGPWSYQFSSPTAITFDQYGYMYVMDAGNDRVQKWLPGAAYGVTVAKTTMATPHGLKFDRQSNLVIADTSYHRVISFGQLCPASTTTTAAPPTQPVVPVCPTAVWNQTLTNLAGSMSNAGSTSTLLNYPYDVDFDQYRNMYVVDCYNHRIQRFAPGSNIGLTVAGFSLGSGASRSELYYPTGISVTPTGTMYILDTSNYRVLKWQVGEPLGYVVAGGRGSGSTFDRIGATYGIFIDSQENIYLSEQTNHRVTFWTRGNTTAGVLAAGGNGAGNTPDKLNSPWGVYVDVNGTIFVVDRGNHRVQKWTPAASVGTTVAGSTSDPGPYAYQFNNPTAISFDSYGYMYILDYNNARVQRWLPGASYGTTVVSASMNLPVGMRFDRLGNMIIADTSYHRVISFGMTCPASTTTTTAPPMPARVPICATAVWNQTFSINAGATSNWGSTATLLYNPYDLDFDGYQNLYVVDYSNHRIQRFSPGSFSGVTVAGITGVASGSRSTLYYPTSISVTRNGTMFIMDTSNYRVIRWDVGEPQGLIVAGGQGGGAAFNQIGASYELFVDNQYNVYVSENSNHRITLWTTLNMTWGVLVAGGNGAGNTPEKLNSPWGIYVDANRTMYIVDRANHRVQRWGQGASVGTTVAGSTSDAGPWSYQLSSPTSIAVDPLGYLYIMDFGNERVQRWWPGANYGVTVASANMYNPYGMAIDPLGNMFIADTSYHRIISFGMTCPASTTTTAAPPTQAVVPVCPTAVWNQTITMMAGATSNAGSTATLLYYPYDLDFDVYRNMYVVDHYNHRIQRFSPGSFTGTTVAGFSPGAGSSRSELYYPTGITISPSGNMYILDTSNYRVLKWTIGDPLGYVVAGGRGSGSSFDRMGATYGIYIDSQENIYLSEQTNHRVTFWTRGNTTAGVLVAGGNGAGNTAEKLNSPWGVYVDVNGTIYVSDRANHRVQRWDPGANVGTTVAGSTSDPGPWSYQLNNPTAILMDPHGYLYILDYSNARVQKWWPGGSYGSTVISATMNAPIGMKFDRLGNIVIADTSYHRVISFALTCPASTTTTTAPPTSAFQSLCATAAWNSSSTIAAGATSSSGSGATLLSYPYDVAFDGYRNMYVVDQNNHRIQMFRPGSNTGITVAGFSLSSGSGRSELYYPGAIYVDRTGLMYIFDTYNCRILTWRAGEPIGTVVVNGRGCSSTYDRIGRGYGLVVDNQRNIYVSENTNHRVTLWYNGNNTAGTLVAGGNGAGSTSEKLSGPWGIYVDSSAGLYVVDRGNHRIQYWAAGAAVGITVAGDSAGSAGPFSYQLNSPTAILFDNFGFMFILDSGNSRIQKWFPGATFGTTVLAATMSAPSGMRLDLFGNLAVADTNYHRVQVFPVWCQPTTTTTPRPPTQTTVALCITATWNSSASLIVGSTGSAGSTATFLSSPYDLAFDQYGNMYAADAGNHRIQQYRPGSNIGTTVAGITGSAGSALAQLNNPSAVYIDQNDDMYILDTSNYRVLRWSIGDQLGTIVVNGRGAGSTLDRIGVSYAMFVDSQSNIYVSEYGNHRVTRWTSGNNTAGQLVAGGSGWGTTSDKLYYPWGIYVDSNQAVYVVDRGNHRIQKWVVGIAFGITVAGESGVSGPWSYQFSSPTAIMFDQSNYMYILDAGNNRIQKWLPGATFGVTLVSSTMSNPYGLHFDSSNNFVVADTSNHRIVSFNIMCPPTTTSVSPFPTLPANLACQTGVFNTSWSVVAGTSMSAGNSLSHLSSPTDVFIDGNFNLYIADTSNSRIQRYRPGATSANTVAGFTLGGGNGLSQLNSPTAVFVDLVGSMYIADNANYRVQKWLANEPLGTTVAGGRGNGATLDKIGVVYAIFVDAQGSVFVSENSNHRVTLWFAWNNTAGEIVAGGNGLGNSSIQLNSPWGVHVDTNRTVYVVDRGNHRVQQWFRGQSFGSTIAGVSGVAGATATTLSSPTAITFDTNNFMYVMDAGNNRVQRFAPGSLVADTVVATSLSNPRGMRLDNLGNIYIADQSNHRVIYFRCVYNSTTTTITTVTTTSGPTTSTTSTSTTSTTTRTTTTTSATTTTTSATTTSSTSTSSSTSTTSTSTTSTATTTTTETTTTDTTTTSQSTTSGPPTTSTTATTTTATTATTETTTTATVTTTTPPTTVTTTTTTVITTTVPPTTTTVPTTTTTGVTTTTTVTTTTPTTTAVTTAPPTTTIATTVATTTGVGVTVATTASTTASGGSGSGSVQIVQVSGSSSNQNSSDIATIVGGVVGGACALGMLIGVAIALVRHCKANPANQVTSSAPQSGAMRVENVSSAPGSSTGPKPPASKASAKAPPKPEAPKNTPPKPGTPSHPPQKPGTPDNPSSPSEAPANSTSTKQVPSTKVDINARSYNIHIIK